MLKRLAHKTILGAERFAARNFNRTGKGREIDPYIGYATPDQIILRGRVLSKLRHATPEQNQSRLGNLRQMLGMFFTDEVAGTTVKCAEHEAITDAEGYFQILLPRDGRTGWRSEQVFVEGRTEAVECPVFVEGDDARFMVISDIDDTMMETGAYSLVRNLLTSFTGNSTTRKIFPDSKALMSHLSQDATNPIYYVSSSPWNMHDFLADVFEHAGLVRGPMFLRDLGFSETQFITEGHSNHKGASIESILRANPDLPAILLGDTGQHDAQIYRDVVANNPGRIAAVGLRTPGPGMDDADRDDFQALRATGVPSFAEPNFANLPRALERACPELFS